VIKFGHEASWNGTSFEQYDPRSILAQPGQGVFPDDAAADLRSLVQSGGAKVDAKTTFDGVAAYRLTVSGASPHYLNGTVYVARDDFRPLRIEMTIQAGLDGIDVAETIDYTRYEYLPADDEITALLDLGAQHPGAQVVDAPADGITSTTSK
jgi:hypothetical protein